MWKEGHSTMLERQALMVERAWKSCTIFSSLGRNVDIWPHIFNLIFSA
jgi:hypothetical protein